MSYYPPDEELPPLGALNLDYTDDIHRPPGDPLNEDSFEFPLIHQLVEGATVQSVVFSGVYPDEFVQKFADACNKLQERGAAGVITSCGFLAQLQSRLSAMVTIPIASSSLLQIPSVFAILPPSKKIAVLTFDKKNLQKPLFDGVGIPLLYQERIVVYGCSDDGHIKDFIIEGGPYIKEKLEEELVTLAQSVLAEHDDIGAFVLECTQMPPTAKAIQKATGLPVFDVITMINWFYSGIRARTHKDDPNKEAGLRRRVRSEKEQGKR